jgi:hypothetical protein
MIVATSGAGTAQIPKFELIFVLHPILILFIEKQPSL